MAVSSRIAQDIIQQFLFNKAVAGSVFHEKLFELQVMAHYSPEEFANYNDTITELLYRGLIERSHGKYALTEQGFHLMGCSPELVAECLTAMVDF